MAVFLLYFSLIALKSRPEERVRSEMGVWLWLHPWQTYASPVTKLFSFVCPAAHTECRIFSYLVCLSLRSIFPHYILFKPYWTSDMCLIDCSALTCLRWGILLKKHGDFMIPVRHKTVPEWMLWIAFVAHRKKQMICCRHALLFIMFSYRYLVF